MLNRLIFILTLLSASLVTGAPRLETDIEPRAVNCALVSTVVNYFVKSTASASSFCSAYLQTTTTTTLSVVSTSTKLTTTSLPKIVTTTTSTSTSTFTTSTVTTMTVAPQAKKREAAPAPTAALGITRKHDDAALNHKRAKRAAAIHDIPREDELGYKVALQRDSTVAYPVWLPKNILPALVSTACSCYVVPPTPKTITSTKTTGTTTTTSTITLPAMTTTMTSVTTTTTTVTTTSTATVFLTCNVKGCGDSTYLENADNAQTVQDCKFLCLADSNCQSFQFVPDNNVCNSFTVSVANGAKVPGTESTCPTAQFYDRDCSV